MKRSITLVTSAVVLLLAVSCKEQAKSEAEPKQPAPAKTYSNLEKANWFLGEWGNKSAEGELTERWKKQNDSVFHGESYFVVGSKDTVFAEHVQMEEANGKLAYTVTVPGQNNEKPVRFEMTSGDDRQIIFENPKHDYPNKIVYNKVGSDSLVAEIFGIQKGKPASEKFRMKRR